MMLAYANMIAFGLLFTIWSKNSLLNFTIKVTLLSLFVANLLVIVKA